MREIPFDIQEPLAKARCDFIAEVVYLSACFGIRGGALFLLVFGVAIKNLESWRAGCLDGVGATAPREMTRYP